MTSIPGMLIIPPEKEEHNYVFPKAFAKAMKMIDQRTQYESALMSMLMILLGMIVFTVYMDFFTSNSLWFKILFTFNALAGVGMLTSFMVTQYQAYVNFMEITDEIKKSQGSLTSLGPDTPSEEKPKQKRTRKKKEEIVNVDTDLKGGIKQ